MNQDTASIELMDPRPAPLRIDEPEEKRRPGGGISLMSGVGERQVTSENSKCSGMDPPGQEAGYPLNILAIPPVNF